VFGNTQALGVLKGQNRVSANVHNESKCLDFSSSKTEVIKACWVQLHKGGLKNAHSVSWKHMGKVSLERLQCCWEGNINKNLKERERKNVEWNNVQRLNFVKAKIKS